MPFKTKPTLLATLLLTVLSVLATTAIADVPRNWGLNFQPAATDQAERMHDFHNLLVVIITLITFFVLALMIYVMVRFRASRNPVPTRTSHNTLVEVIWTVVPVIILVLIAIPSFKLLYYLDRTDQAEMTLKIIGRQWYWSYEYPDQGNFTFDSTMVPESETKPGQHRLLEVDNQIVLPVDTNIRLLFTASDVLHSWTVPAFGVKQDTIPGRTNESWVRITREGTFYGQCSELCGVGHAYMPIAVRAVSKAEFEQWTAEARQKFARIDDPQQQVAQMTAQPTAGSPAAR